MTADLFEWIAAAPPAAALRRSALLYIVVNAAHILSIRLLIGAILPLDLRLMGWFQSVPLAVIGPFLSTAAATGLALAILTGALLFSVRPAEYAENPAFLAKLSIIALGILNAILIHTGKGWRHTLADEIAPRRIRYAAGISLCAWIASLLAGRWIGFL